MWWYRENEFVSEVGRTEGEVEMLLLVSFMKCVAILKLRHSTPLIVLQIELIDVHDSILDTPSESQVELHYPTGTYDISLALDDKGFPAMSLLEIGRPLCLGKEFLEFFRNAGCL
jgi:hypothetical protein